MKPLLQFVFWNSGWPKTGEWQEIQGVHTFARLHKLTCGKYALFNICMKRLFVCLPFSSAHSVFLCSHKIWFYFITSHLQTHAQIQSYTQTHTTAVLSVPTSSCGGREELSVTYAPPLYPANTLFVEGTREEYESWIVREMSEQPVGETWRRGEGEPATVSLVFPSENAERWELEISLRWLH